MQMGDHETWDEAAQATASDDTSSNPQDDGDGAEAQGELPAGEDATDSSQSGIHQSETHQAETHQAESSPAEDDESEDESSSSLGPGEELTDEELVREVAALLFASVEPLTLGKLTSLLLRPRRGRVKDALAALANRLEAADLPLQVRSIKGGFALMTLPELGPVVERLLSGPTVERVSAAALETLAVVAYRQPVTKAEIEAIRGVQAGPILRSLVDRGLIKVAGRADVPGNPLQYATTKDFLDRFGLQGVSDLPRDAELAQD
ncbi:MAG: SMC-Scp complex subunit ScpB [Planctomycetes bacterium]|nr:SMC-Scp complex subunit ScpB [Planctomycetota bacterium]MCB9908732.1 SMC-Scp complex subunit ScpB [Planctomycetota bacterium]MCB9912443.1 SMC-Scp complex subunit ScpB [Planctomycetota bacterium]